MNLGTNIKYQMQTVFETAFDEKSAKQVEKMYEQMSKRVADSTREEFVEAFQSFGQVLNNALKQLKLQPIDISKMIELPNAQMFSQLGSEFGARFAEGFGSAVASGGGISDVIQKQIKDLEAQKESLLKKQKTLPKNLEYYEKLSGVSTMEKGDFRAFSKKELAKKGSDVTQVAKTMLNELDISQSHLSSLQKGTQEFSKGLLDFYRRAYDVFRMSRTLSKSPDLVSDKSVLQSYDFDALQGVYNSEGNKHSLNAYDQDFSQLIEKQESLLDRLPSRIEKINQELINLQQNSGNIIPTQETETGLKSLNEIEAAYKRILNAKGKVGKQGSNIESVLNFDPSTSKKLKTLYQDYVNLSPDANWEVEYQALLKYVKLYESYLNSDNELYHKQAQYPEFKTLYEQLKPIAANAENMLRNVLNMAYDKPLVGMGGVSAEASNAERVADANHNAAEGAERKAKADTEAAAAEAKARREAEAEAKVKQDSTNAIRRAAEEAERKARADATAAEAVKQEGSARDKSLHALINEYEAASNSTKKIVDDLAMIRSATSSTTQDGFNKLNPSQENKDTILSAFDKYKHAIQEISNMPIIETEDDKQRLLELQKTIIKLKSVLQQAFVPNTTPEQYAERYGLALEDATSLKSAVNPGESEFIKIANNAKRSLFAQLKTENEALYTMVSDADNKRDVGAKHLSADERLKQTKELQAAWRELINSINSGERGALAANTEAINAEVQAQEHLNNVEKQNLPTQDESGTHNANADAIKKEAQAQEKLNQIKKGQSYSGAVYHGSKLPLENVDYDPTKGKGQRNVGNGLYFTPDLEQAAKHGKNILQSNVQLDNVFTFTKEFITDIDALYQAMGKVKPAKTNWDIVKRDLHATMQQPGKAQEFTKNMRQMGYQGMYSKGYGYADPNVEQLVVYDEAYHKNLTTQPYKEIVSGANAAKNAVDSLNNSLQKKNAIENADNNGAEIAEENTETEAIKQQNATLKENINLKAQANRQGVVAPTGTGGTVTPTQTVPNGATSAEAGELETVRAKVLEVTNAVNAKTQAFLTEQKAVKSIAQSEVYALGEVEKKVTAVRVALGNIQTKKHNINLSIAGGKDVSNITATEMDALTKLRAALQLVTKRVNEKTQAFETEKSVVNTVVNSEINALSRLNAQVDAVNTTVLNLLKNIQTAQSGAANVVVPQAQPISQNDNDVSGQVETINTLLGLHQELGYQQERLHAAEEKYDEFERYSARERINELRRLIAMGERSINITEQLREQFRVARESGSNGQFKSESTATSDRSIVPYRDGAESTNADQKLTEQINTAATSLLKYKTTLQEANQLSGDLETGINNLYTELGQVSKREDLTIWSEHFKQFKNASSIIQTLVKDYQALGVAQAKAAMEADATRQMQYLDDAQIIQDRIDTKSVDVNVGDDRFEEARQRAYNVTTHELQQKQELVNASQNEAEVVKQLVTLYEQLGRARAKGDDTTGIRANIKDLRSNLSSVDYATDMKFKAATDKGFNAEQTKANNAYLKEQEGILQKLNAAYQEYGVLIERANATQGANLAAQISDEADAKLAEINGLRQSLDIITPEMAQGFDEAFNMGKAMESRKQYEALAKKSDQDEISRRKKIESLESEIGKLRAEVDGATNDGVKNALEQEIQLRKDLIALQEQGLAMDAQDEAYFRKRYADNTKQAKDVAKQEQREQATTFKDAIAASQKAAGLTRSSSVATKAETALTSAMGIDGISESQIATLEQYRSKIISLKSLITELRNQNGVVNPSQKQELTNQTVQVDAYTKEIQELIANYERLSGPNAESLNVTSKLGLGASAEAYKKELTNAVKTFHKGQASIKSYDAETKTLIYTLKTGKGEFTQYAASVRQTDDALMTVRGTTTKAMGVFESIGKKIKEYSYYFTGSMMFMRVFSELKKGISIVKEIDSALTELKKVTDATEETYDRFLDTAAKTASKVGSTVKEVVSSTADWARLNI